MKAASKIDQSIAAIKQQRIAWLSEKPKVPIPRSDDPAEFLDALRAEYRWYMQQHARLIKARNAIQALIDECELSMSETEHAADLMSDISEKTRLASQYADKGASCES